MKFMKSLLELTLLTYAVAFLGLLSASGFDLLYISALKAAAAASLPTALAVVYGALARLLGDRNSALAVSTRDRDH